MNSIDYGSVTYEGKEYRLTQEAYETSRLFYGSWNDRYDDGTFEAEYAASAVDEAGNKYEVTWHFPATPGEEPEDESNWPWGDEHIVKVELIAEAKNG